MESKSFKKAAEAILKELNRPLTKDEICSLALEKGLVQTEGQTPAATMAAQLYIDIKKNPNSKFMLIGKGKFALKNQTLATDPKVVIEQQNLKLRSEIKEKLMEMDPYQFEFFVGELLTKIGYDNVEITKRSGDQGIDINAVLTLDGITDVKTVVQVKRYSKNVEDKVIRELRGSAEVDQRGLVITTAGFTKPARTEAKAPNKMPVSLIDGDRLVDLMVKYEVGIKKELVIILSSDDEFFELENNPKFSSVITGKNRSIWPLPGGNTNYIKTLDEFLMTLDSTPMSKDNAAKWFIDNFEQVNSSKTALSYVMVPKLMGLIELVNGKLAVSEEGKEYLLNKSKDFLFDVIEKNIFLFKETLDYVKSSEEPVKEGDVLEFVNSEYDVGWQSEIQVLYRLLWLMNLGKIEKKENGFL